MLSSERDSALPVECLREIQRRVRPHANPNEEALVLANRKQDGSRGFHPMFATRLTSTTRERWSRVSRCRRSQAYQRCLIVKTPCTF